MAHPEELRIAVRNCYVFDHLSLESAAIAHKIPVSTVKRWKVQAKGRGDDWDKLRAASLLAGDSLDKVLHQTLTGLILQTNATIEAINKAPDIKPAEKVSMLASLADSNHKIVASQRRMMPETDRYAVALDVVKRLGEFIARKNPAMAIEFTAQLEAFGDELQKVYG